MTPPQIRSFDELSVGQELQFGSLVLTEAAILDYARQWDPQPFHTDPEAAAAGPFGGLIASGLHTLSAAFGHILHTRVMERVSMGGAGLDVRWPNPVRPGDAIAIAVRVEELTPSRSRPDRGTAKLRIIGTREGDGAVVLDVLGTHILRR